MKSEDIKNNIVFKIWDYFILLLVVVAIGMLIYSYFLVIPETYKQFDRISIYISFVFLLDVLLRIILFKKEYLFSTEIIIDVLACADIFSPALKAARGVKYTRMTRLIRLFRILRVFRGVKATKHLSQSKFEEKAFNIIALVLILSFVMLSVVVTNYLHTKIFDNMKDQYTQLTKSLLIATHGDKNKLMSLFELRDDIVKYQIKSNKNKITKNIVSEETVKKEYFPDDLIDISVGGKVNVTYIVKSVSYYLKTTELLIIITSLPVLFLMLFIIHFMIVLYLQEPAMQMCKTIGQYSEFIQFQDVSENSTDFLDKIKLSYNDAVGHYNKTVWEYYESYKKVTGENNKEN